MAPRSDSPLRNITREDLEPFWSRPEIPLARIAQALGVSREGVSYKARVLGLPSRKGNHEPLKKLDDTTFARLWNAGVSMAEMIAFGGYTSRSSIEWRRKRLGLPKRRGRIDIISLAEFREMELARAMRESVRKVAA